MTERAMKDSGVEWIGEIPEHWKTSPFKHLCEIKSGDFISKDSFIDNGMYPVIGSNGEIGRTNLINNIKPVITTGRVGTIGTIQTVSSAWITDNALIIDTKLNYDFAKFLIHCFDFQNLISGTAQPLITGAKLKQQIIPVPPETDQSAIANFLDEKCAEIDALSSDIRKQIDVLEQYRKSVIYEAVTMGLEKQVTLKNSGVEYLGKIPQHWTTKPIKYSFDITSGATPDSTNPDFWDGDIPWVTPADYKTKDRYISHGRKFITKAGFNACSTVLLPQNALIFSKRAPIGSVAVTRNPLCTNQGCLSCVSADNSSIDYLYYVCSIFTDQFELLGSGTTFKEISAVSFANFILPNPPLVEQTAIANYLDEKCTEIDATIEAKRQQLETLAEYRRSMIYEYVTGKRTVLQ